MINYPPPVWSPSLPVRRTSGARVLSIRTLLLALAGALAWVSGFSTPTQGMAPVALPPLNQTMPPTASAARGFYDAPQPIELTTVTPGAQIRFTLDGTPPTPNSGTLYTGPIGLTTTTVLSAIAYMPDNSLEPSPLVVQSYIFPAAVPGQNGQPPGYPDEWFLFTDSGSLELPADYDMDPEIVTDPAYRDVMHNALTDIPTVSLVLDKDALFDTETGIYQNALESGPDWERPVSLEVIYPDGRPSIQIHAGLRILGGDSRQAHKSPKHSFRVLFKSAYGPTKLEAPLFADYPETRIDATDSFDTLVLRAGYNNTWIHRGDRQRAAAQYLRDHWMRDSQLAMGQPSGHGQFVHLYLNGLYWGLYDLHERPSAPFVADYFGGHKSEYDVLNSGEPVDGERHTWDVMVDIASSGVADDGVYRALQEYLDLENLVDYVLLNHYAGNIDWDRKNWYAARRRAPGAGYTFFSWDAEKVLGDLDEDIFGAVNPSSPTHLFHNLTANPEFRMLYADRVYHHLFNSGLSSNEWGPSGALTPEAAVARYSRLSETIVDAVVAESARWGDYRRDVHPYESGPYELYTRDDFWRPERQRLLEAYLPQRRDRFLELYRYYDIYPDVDPPQIVPAGGAVETQTPVGLTNPNGRGAIWYTLDGSDPRPSYNVGPPRGINGGASVTFTLQSSALVQARVLADGEWSALHRAEFFPPPDPHLDDLRITEIMAHPPSGSEYEFIELHNAGSHPLDVGGLRLSDGISYTLPAGARLAAQDYLVLARNPTFFAERYGFRPFNRTGYRGKLSNEGETVTLIDAHGAPVRSVHFAADAPERVLAAGAGFSLVAAATDEAPDWRTSAAWGGSPQQADPPPRALPPVRVNEVLAHAAAPNEPFVELYNPTGETVDIGGWYLTNDPEQPTRFRIPVGTRLIGYDYVAFPIAQLGFAFEPRGDGVYLFSADAAGNLTGYGHGFRFGASEPNVSIGRCYVAADTTTRADAAELPERFVTQPRITPNRTNGSPLPGIVVISEVMYNPLSGHEFIELTNLADRTVPLFDPDHPQNMWRIDGIGDFRFPPDTTIAPGGVLLVVPIEPSIFRSTYRIPASVPIFGPYAGRLNNAGERITLEWPGAPARNGTFAYIAVDAVAYEPVGDWPIDAAGGGPSLERIRLAAFGDTALNWQASAARGGTPGALPASADLALVNATHSYARYAPGGNSGDNSGDNSGNNPKQRLWLPLVLKQELSAQTNPCLASTDLTALLPAPSANAPSLP